MTIELNDYESGRVLQRAAESVRATPAGLTLVSKPGWFAVPYPAGSAELMTIMASFREAARLSHDAHLYIAAVSSPYQEGRVLKVTTEDLGKPSDISLSRKNARLSDIIVLPESERWSVFLGEGDYSVVLGEHDFVASIVGKANLADAYQSFSEYRNRWSAAPPYINALAENDWTQYAKAIPGTHLTIAWKN